MSAMLHQLDGARKVAQGIHWAVAPADLEVQVRSARVSGSPHLGDDVPLRHDVTPPRAVRPIVRVDGGVVADVPDDDQVPVLAETRAAVDDAPRLRGAHERPGPGGEVDAVVPSAAPAAPARGEAALHGPGEGDPRGARVRDLLRIGEPHI